MAKQHISDRPPNKVHPPEYSLNLVHDLVHTPILRLFQLRQHNLYNQTIIPRSKSLILRFKGQTTTIPIHYPFGYDIGMGKNGDTSKIIDEIIAFSVTTSAIAAGMLLPNLMIALDKPLRRFDKKLTARERERQARRIIYYMKEQGYLVGEYDHGLQITEKARKRHEKTQIEKLRLKPQDVWDHRWRIILYDIPEERAAARHAFLRELRLYGCVLLQRSVMITAFPCLEDIETIAARLSIDTYVTFFEAQKLANDKPLIERFKKKYPNTTF